jgi:hypothetical protein
VFGIKGCPSAELAKLASQVILSLIDWGSFTSGIFIDILGTDILFRIQGDASNAVDWRLTGQVIEKSTGV